jgi:chaperone BCS1
MEINGAPGTAGLSSPGDLILQQRKDAIQAAAQPTGDGGLFSQLASNPFFTAVSRQLWNCECDGETLETNE